MKQKIVFTSIMGIITTGIISYALISINIGWAHSLLHIWLKAWLISYIIAVPIILIFSPMIESFVKKVFAKME